MVYSSFLVQLCAKIMQVHPEIVKGNPNTVAHMVDALDILTILPTFNQIFTFAREPEISEFR